MYLLLWDLKNSARSWACDGGRGTTAGKVCVFPKFLLKQGFDSSIISLEHFFCALRNIPTVVKIIRLLCCYQKEANLKSFKNVEKEVGQTLLCYKVKSNCGQRVKHRPSSLE